ncbi:MAG TPA: choice-of-anchor D domain-containing protein, partial [Casimicrobiaceae bacterium]|nr:choice-of-anchor D domain-containing protein [Casimicrobiaceae bacterium]
MVLRLLARRASVLSIVAIALVSHCALAGPRFCISNDTLQFGNREVGSSTHASATVANCGDAPWSFTSVALHPATNAQFHVDSTCTDGLVLASGASCAIDVSFAPLQPGEVSGALWLHNTTSTPDQLLTFYGRGVDAQAGTASLAFTPALADFGNTTLGTQSGPLVVMLTNTAAAALTPSALVLNGTQPYDFQSASMGDPSDCAVGRSIASGTSCRLNLYFRPQQQGTRNATLVVDAPQLAALASMRITGVGVTLADPGAVEVVEFHHVGSGQYFLTADAAEKALLDSGGLSGWSRTGAVFHAWARDAITPAIDVPVCRFFGVPGVGPDSHFFSAEPH